MESSAHISFKIILVWKCTAHLENWLDGGVKVDVMYLGFSLEKRRFKCCIVCTLRLAQYF